MHVQQTVAAEYRLVSYLATLIREVSVTAAGTSMSLLLRIRVVNGRNSISGISRASFRGKASKQQEPETQITF